MFAVEVEFKDQKGGSETLFVRRPEALIGADDSAHVIIDEMAVLPYRLLISRGVGREFRCVPIATNSASKLPDFLENTYERVAVLELGDFSLRVTSLDVDLAIRDKEPPDRAGVRVLRQAATAKSPLFPAVAWAKDAPVIVSFQADSSVIVGRSKRCALRIETDRVADEHARIGFEGENFWVEDLGTQQGTFVGGHQIAARTTVKSGERVTLGNDTVIMPFASERDLVEPQPTDTGGALSRQQAMNLYPVMLSKSAVVRPSRLVLRPNSSIYIGRDPNSDVWVGAPHVSRRHAVIAINKTGLISIQDQSRNGTAYDQGTLRKGESLEVGAKAVVLDFGDGVTIAICLSKVDEERYLSSGGSRFAFSPHLKGAEKRAESGGAVIDSISVANRHGPAGRLVKSFYRLSDLVASYGNLGRLTVVLLVVLLLVVFFVLLDLLLPAF